MVYTPQSSIAERAPNYAVVGLKRNGILVSGINELAKLVDFLKERGCSTRASLMACVRPRRSTGSLVPVASNCCIAGSFSEGSIRVITSTLSHAELLLIFDLSIMKCKSFPLYSIIAISHWKFVVRILATKPRELCNRVHCHCIAATRP
jgi:hypothetical protein